MTKLLTVLLLLVALTGCENMARAVVKMHGVKVDPFPGPCAPASAQAGQCLKVKQVEQR